MEYMNYTTVHLYPPVYSTTKQAENLGLVMSVGVLALALGSFVLLWKLSECWKSYYISRIAQLVSKMKASGKLKVKEKMALQAAHIDGGDPSSKLEPAPDQCRRHPPSLDQDPPPAPAASVTRGRSSTYAGTTSHSQSEQAIAGGRMRSSTYAGVSRPWPDEEGHVLQGEKEIEIRTQEQQTILKQGSRTRSSTYAGPSHSQQDNVEQTMQGRVRSRTYAGCPSHHVLRPPPPPPAESESAGVVCQQQQQQLQRGSRLRSSTYTMGESSLQLEELEQRRARRSTFAAGEGPSHDQQQHVRWDSSREVLPPYAHRTGNPRLNEFADEIGEGEEEDSEEIVPQRLHSPWTSENRRSTDQGSYRTRSSTLAYGEGFQSHQIKPWTPSTPQQQQQQQSSSSSSSSSSATGTYNRSAQNRNVGVAAAASSQPQLRSRDFDVVGECSKQQQLQAAVQYPTAPPSSCPGGQEPPVRLGPAAAAAAATRSCSF